MTDANNRNEVNCCLCGKDVGDNYGIDMSGNAYCSRALCASINLNEDMTKLKNLKLTCTGQRLSDNLTEDRKDARVCLLACLVSACIVIGVASWLFNL